MAHYDGSCDDFEDLLTIPLHNDYGSGNGFADSTTGEVPREPSVEQVIIDLTAEHEGDEAIELSDPWWEEVFNGDAAEVLPLYENCIGCSDCEPGCSNSRQSGWGQSSGASDHSACDDDESDWSESQMNTCDQASGVDDDELPSSGQQTPNSIQAPIDENLYEQIENPQPVHEFGNIILVQIEQFKNHFDNRDRELHSRLDTFDRKLQQLDDRVRQIYVQLDAHDGAIHLGLDRQRLAIEEIARDLRHQIQTTDNSIGRLHNLTQEQIRERRLMFEAVYAMVFPIFYP